MLNEKITLLTKGFIFDITLEVESWFEDRGLKVSCELESIFGERVVFSIESIKLKDAFSLIVFYNKKGVFIVEDYFPEYEEKEFETVEDALEHIMTFSKGDV